MPRPRIADVPTMRPRALDGGPPLVDRAEIARRIRYGSLLDQQRDDLRARLYFDPETARRLRAASNQAVGFELGGTREAQPWT